MFFISVKINKLKPLLIEWGRGLIMKKIKKYKVVAKVGGDHFVKYNVNNLRKFAVFLDSNFPQWRWFNVYKYTKEGKGEQLASFTNKDRPKNAFLTES